MSAQTSLSNFLLGPGGCCQRHLDFEHATFGAVSHLKVEALEELPEGGLGQRVQLRSGEDGFGFEELGDLFTGRFCRCQLLTESSVTT